MFDSQSSDPAQRPLKAVPISHLAREARWSADTPRSYLVPVLMWFTCGQGRLLIAGEMRGYTAHNAIFLPANTPHAFETCGRSQGTALFLGGRPDLPVPSEVLHLRFATLQQQIELTQHVEGFRRDCAANGPLAGEILHYRAALISLWLIQQSLIQQTVRAPVPREQPSTAETPLRSASDR